MLMTATKRATNQIVTITLCLKSSSAAKRRKDSWRSWCMMPPMRLWLVRDTEEQSTVYVRYKKQA